MDERLKKQVIAVAVVMVTIVAVTVVLANYIKTGKMPWEKDTGSTPTYQTTQADTSEDGAQTGTNANDYVSRFNLNPMRDYNAFLGDDAFFDPVVEHQDPNVMLGMLVNSVEKDMRVNVINGNGLLVKDQDFKVVVKDATGNERTYKDADRDGSIYIAPVDPGDYEVTLESVDGYIVAEDTVSVTVKEQIEYTLVDDISYLIKSENEIDPTVEDTAINEAEANADGTESNVKLDAKDAMFGIDVSKWNKDIDWQKVKAAGVDFAIIRCGYRGSKTGALVEDPYFVKNIEGATEAGIKVGIYFFTQATNEVEGVEEASMVLSLCSQYKIALPIFIDTEGAGGNGRADGISIESRTAACQAFCKTIENSGFNAGVYASKHWLNNNLTMDDLDEYTVWLAQYSHEATYKGDYNLWQYTSAGTIDGINTRVDLNLCYKKY